MSKPYEGAAMLVCPLELSDFQHVCAVIVSGHKVNPCGHTLLHIGKSWSWYVHISGPYNLPKFMPQSNYMRYLKENGKREIRRSPIKLPNPKGAHEKLHELIEKPWIWGAVVHNCTSFEEEVVRAGGSNAGQYFNCPIAERFG
ncbi:hypothetical protein [Massilia horti]|uniref:Uncharacterized protein n=1 Tax=Massilia horti TaxID=2562153 RepID=A0A4Y9SNB1_9BURK|nr:hypothetical protein [Massilia horti]TFW27941.1 hypothetical protein E4O92_22510 [Massilia horti]